VPVPHIVWPGLQGYAAANCHQQLYYGGCFAAGGYAINTSTEDNDRQLTNFYKKDSLVQLATSNLPKGWVSFYRVDDVSATAYFYLDKPSSNLPALQNVWVRTYHLKSK